MDGQQRTFSAAPARRQLMLLLAPYLITTALLVALATLSLDVLSATRAYVAGESSWSKAQKTAVEQLERYADDGNEDAWNRYLQAIRVPLGDRRARIELERPHPDLDVARSGFLDGRNAVEDVPGMIRLFRYFGGVSYMQRALTAWTAGDREIDEIVAAADALREFRTDASASGAAALARLRAANARVMPLEDAFSATLGEASRRVHGMLETSIVLLAVTLVCIAGLFTRWALRQRLAIERALRLSEQRFEMAVRGSNDGIWNWSPDSGTAYFSPRALELLGYADGVPTGRIDTLLALVHDDDRAAVQAALAATLREHAPLDVEFRFRDPRGAPRWAQLRGRAIDFDGGRVVRLAGSIGDVSERRRVDEERRRLAADEQRRAERAQIALLEQVQGRVGRELHDDLGQQLTGVAFLAKALEQRLGNESPTERDQTSWIVRLINAAIDRIRFMSRQLSPIAIDEVTLGTALTRLVDDVHEIFGTRISLQMWDGEAQVPAPQANQLFRIAQESISNALRHGQATQIVVRLDTRAGRTRLAVCDNGRGFRVREIDPNASLGLRSMRIRTESLGGRLRIRSGTRGTVLAVRSPAAEPSSASEPERMSA